VAIGCPIGFSMIAAISVPAQKARTIFIAVPRIPLVPIAAIIAQGTAVAAFVLESEVRFATRIGVTLTYASSLIWTLESKPPKYVSLMINYTFREERNTYGPRRSKPAQEKGKSVRPSAY